MSNVNVLMEISHHLHMPISLTKLDEAAERSLRVCMNIKDD